MSAASSSQVPTLDIHFGDNLPIIRGFPDASFDMIYIDPPFNTGRTQTRTQIKTIRDDAGDREVTPSGSLYQSE